MSDTAPEIDVTIADILAGMDAQPDQALGGPAADAARDNARRIAAYLLGLHASASPLPRHAGKASPGKVAAAVSRTKRFNRQNFGTNEWCAKLLAAYDVWENDHGATRLQEAQAATDQKEPQNKRMAELERELLLSRAETQQVRRELHMLRDFIARTGRLP